MSFARSILAGTLAAGLCSSALAQDLGVKAPPQSKPIVIQGATTHTVANGTIENGYVFFDGGVIRTSAPSRCPDSRLPRRSSTAAASTCTPASSRPTRSSA